MAGEAVLALGMMSGTSMDGAIDVALLRSDGEGRVERLAWHAYAYEDPEGERPFHRLIKAAELALGEADADLERARALYPRAALRYLAQVLAQDERRAQRSFAALSEQLLGCGRTGASLDALIEKSTALHSAAVGALLERERVPASALDVIGYHGQTLLHRPLERISVQVGDAQRLADDWGVPVVCALREADLRAGGEGAPLAPIYHHALAHALGLAPCAFVNLGGCSNVTLVRGGTDELIAFDAGPGNALLDRFAGERTGQPMDRDGALALRGAVDAAALAALVRGSIRRGGRNYLELPPPKSLDVRDPQPVPELAALSAQDGCATLAAFTAHCIAAAAQQLADAKVELPARWVIGGGGARNPALLRELERQLRAVVGARLELADAAAFGLASAALEAELIAYLAIRSRRGLPITFPHTTGVARPQCGGRSYAPAARP